MKTKLWLVAILCLRVFGFAQTYTFSTLASFPRSSQKSAVYPFAPIIDPSGNLYGISYSGGAYNGGTIFKVTPAGKVSVLYSFPYRSFPGGTLIRDSAGNLYGQSIGVVFKLTPTGKFIVLHTFTAGGPPGSLARDSAGNLYGYDGVGTGSLFKLTPSGSYSLLYTFCAQSNCADGSNPVGAPIIKPNGNFYGNTSDGGSLNDGTIFEVTPQGRETVLYSFMGGSDGANPTSKLTQDAAGNLYGTTYNGGGSNYFSDGVVFKLTPSGVESVLYAFCSLGGCADGVEPEGPVILDAAGNVYGTTSEGGSTNDGVVFRLSPSGEETILYDAPGAPGVGTAVVMDKSGNLYGTTVNGGGPHNGTAYKLTKN